MCVHCHDGEGRLKETFVFKNNEQVLKRVAKIDSVLVCSSLTNCTMLFAVVMVCIYLKLHLKAKRYKTILALANQLNNTDYL